MSTNNHDHVSSTGCTRGAESRPCQAVSLAMSTSFPPSQDVVETTPILSSILDWLEDVPRCEEDVMQHCTGGDDGGDKGVVDLQSPEEQWSLNESSSCRRPALQWERASAWYWLKLCALPLQWFSIWGDDGHRSFHAGGRHHHPKYSILQRMGNHKLIYL